MSSFYLKIYGGNELWIGKKIKANAKWTMRMAYILATCGEIGSADLYLADHYLTGELSDVRLTVDTAVEVPRG